MNKIAIIACLLVSTAVAHHVDSVLVHKYLDNLAEQIKECSEELKVDPTVEEKLINHEEVSERDVGCMRACVYKKIGAIIDGKLSTEKIFDFIKEVHTDDKEKHEPLKKVVQECIDKANAMEDECAASFAATKCYYVNAANILTQKTASV